MSPMEKLRELLFGRFPNATIEVQKADSTKGFQFLNLRFNSLEVAVEWKHDEGFGVSSFNEDSGELDGLFESPNEWFSNPESTFYRIVSLMFERKST